MYYLTKVWNLIVLQMPILHEIEFTFSIFVVFYLMAESHFSQMPRTSGFYDFAYYLIPQVKSHRKVLSLPKDFCLEISNFIGKLRSYLYQVTLAFHLAKWFESRRTRKGLSHQFHLFSLLICTF